MFRVISLLFLCIYSTANAVPGVNNQEISTATKQELSAGVYSEKPKTKTRVYKYKMAKDGLTICAPVPK